MPLRTPHPRARPMGALAAAAFLALGAAGCSDDSGGSGEGSDNSEEAGGGSPPPEASPSPSPVDEAVAAELEEAVRAYTEAFFAPDADAAFAWVSERCRDTIDPEIYAAQLDQAAADHGQLGVETFTVEEVTGETARVTYTVGVPLFDERLTGQPWTREAEGWRFDAC